MVASWCVARRAVAQGGLNRGGASGYFDSGHPVLLDINSSTVTLVGWLALFNFQAQQRIPGCPVA
jgi:hypothetical protein